MKIPKNLNNITKRSIKTAKNASKVTDEIKAYTDSIDDALRNSTKKAEDSIENLKKATKAFKSSSSNNNINSSKKYNGSLEEYYGRLNKLAEEYIHKDRTIDDLEAWKSRAKEISKDYEHLDNVKPKTKPKTETKTEQSSPTQNSKKTQDNAVNEAKIKQPESNINKKEFNNKKASNQNTAKENANKKNYLEPDDIITDSKEYRPNISLENKIKSKIESETANKIKDNFQKFKTNTSKAKDKLLDIENNDNNFFGYDIKLKKKYVVPAGLALAGGTLLYKGLEINERSKLGDIEAGVSVGTVNASFSPTHSKMLDYAQTPEGAEEFKDKVLGRTSGVSISGADAEIVFALHKLRNGG